MLGTTISRSDIIRRKLGGRRRLCRTLVFSFALASSTVRARAADPASAAGKVKRSPPNLLLITMDTTRADHLGAWGYKDGHTPNLDALAARGVRFARCDTAAPITLPSHTTILTGLFPPRHGVRDNGTYVLSPSVETVAERLKARGYDTAAVVSAVVLAKRYGLDQGFRIYDDDLGVGGSGGAPVAERGAEAATNAAVKVMAGLKAPFFLWVHYFDPHEEYRPPARFARAARGPHALYDGEISYMDEQIGALLQKLPAGTDVLAVADHGEMLGEHGEATHGLLLYRAARRVPLLMAGPDVPAGRVSDCLVRTADVTPTLLDLAGAQADSGLDGRSLLPLDKGGPNAACSREAYTETFLPFFSYKWYPLRGLGDERFFYLKAPKSSLFDLSKDPDEKRDLATSEPKEERAWNGKLASFLQGQGEKLDAPVRTETVLSPEQRNQLASLGYVGGLSGGQVTAGLPDPRSMVGLANDLHRAIQDLQAGHCSEALPRLQAIVKQDPHNFVALTQTGLCLREAGRLEPALDQFQKAARENTLDAMPRANAAICLYDLGRKTEAEQEFRRALALDPAQAMAATNLARLLRQRGDLSGAIAVLETALRSGAHEAEIFIELGVAHATSGSLERALENFREASRRAPADPVPIENAAMAAYDLHRLRESVELYEQLLRISPRRADAWERAGALYIELEDAGSALRCFRAALEIETNPAERARLEELVKRLTR